jgi:hypothetical protein
MAPPPKGPSGDYLSAHPLSIILISPIPAIEFSISTTYILYFPAFIGAKMQAPDPGKNQPFLPYRSINDSFLAAVSPFVWAAQKCSRVLF